MLCAAKGFTRILFALTLCSFVCGTPAAALADTPVGQVKSLSGQVSVARDGRKADLSIGSPVFSKDTVVTGSDGRVGITFVDDSRFSAGPNTELALETFRFDRKTNAGRFRANLKRGTLAAVSGKIAKKTPNAMSVRTPSAILGVRGTKFLIEVEGD